MVKDLGLTLRRCEAARGNQARPKPTRSLPGGTSRQASRGRAQKDAQRIEAKETSWMPGICGSCVSRRPFWARRGRYSTSRPSFGSWGSFRVEIPQEQPGRRKADWAVGPSPSKAVSCSSTLPPRAAARGRVIVDRVRTTGALPSKAIAERVAMEEVRRSSSVEPPGPRSSSTSLGASSEH